MSFYCIVNCPQPTGQSLPQVALCLAASSNAIGYIDIRPGEGLGTQVREVESLKKRGEKKQGGG